MEVTVVATGGDVTELTVTRGIGSTVGTAGAAGDGLYIVGNASEENAGARNVNSTQVSPLTNYTLVEIWV